MEETAGRANRDCNGRKSRAEQNEIINAKQRRYTGNSQWERWTHTAAQVKKKEEKE
jgi:hypothetical protein